MSGRVTEVTHPLVQHKLSYLRDNRRGSCENLSHAELPF